MSTHAFTLSLLKANAETGKNIYIHGGALSPISRQLEVLLGIIEKARKQPSIQSSNIVHDTTNLVQSLVARTLDSQEPVRGQKTSSQLAAEQLLRIEQIPEVSSEYHAAYAEAVQAVKSCATKFADTLCAEAQQKGLAASRTAIG